MRLLFLTPTLPSPPRSGGTARMHGLISNLARGHDVAILSFRGQDDDERDSVNATGKYAGLVVTVPNRHAGIAESRKRRGQFRSLTSCRSYERLTYGSDSLQQALDRVCREWHPDVIVVEFAQMGYLRFPDGMPLVFDAHNIEHEIIQRLAQIDGSLPRRVYSQINAWKLRREEIALARRVDRVAVTSERDAAMFEQLVPGCRPAVIPNGVDCRALAPLSPPPEDRALLFFGALDYYPNSDGVLAFYRDVWPALSDQYPDLSLKIVGRQPPAAIRALADAPGVTVTGFVEDIREAIAGAAVVIVPLRAGSGTRLKVLEAMAMGRPVVSTSLGVEGLDVVDGQHLIVADRPGDFVDAVERILDDPQLAARIGAEGRKLVQAAYNWTTIANVFERVIYDATTGATGKQVGKSRLGRLL